MENSEAKNKVLVIALICHFSNLEIQKIIKPWKEVREYAPWIPPFFELFKNYDGVEFHVISPHEYMSGYKNFSQNNIHFHFYNAHVPLYGRHWPSFFKFDFYTDFFFNKRKTKSIIKKIKPDIIHLFGAENAYYSSTILQFVKKYPIVITVQGFISKTSEKPSKFLIKRLKVENEIITKNDFYISNTQTIGKQIISINPKAKIFQQNLPIEIPKPINIQKVYDIVFFARICREKGIEDLLKAVAILKKEKANINLCVIGGGDLKIWKEKAKELNISDNIHWAGFLPTQKDVHNLASSAKISVLPTYNDVISGTIVESLFLKLPVVAYNVGSIYEVNENEKIISLVEKFNILELAKSINSLLENNILRQEIAEKGYLRACEMFNIGNDIIRSNLLNTYTKVINSFHEA